VATGDRSVYTRVRERREDGLPVPFLRDIAAQGLVPIANTKGTRMKRSSNQASRVRLRLVGRLVCWIVPLLVLWWPGVGSHVFSHGDYSWRGHGILSYYAVETERGVTTFAGVRLWALAVTMVLSAIPAVSLTRDIGRFVLLERAEDMHHGPDR
jgi:hypothetical protein